MIAVLTSVWAWIVSKGAGIALTLSVILAAFVGIRKDGVDAQKAKDLEGVLKNLKVTQNVDKVVDALSDDDVDKRMRGFEQ